MHFATNSASATTADYDCYSFRINTVHHNSLRQPQRFLHSPPQRRNRYHHPRRRPIRLMQQHQNLCSHALVLFRPLVINTLAICIFCFDWYVSHTFVTSLYSTHSLANCKIFSSRPWHATARSYGLTWRPVACLSPSAHYLTPYYAMPPSTQ